MVNSFILKGHTKCFRIKQLDQRNSRSEELFFYYGGEEKNGSSNSLGEPVCK
jgi:hypothetical protein